MLRIQLLMLASVFISFEARAQEETVVQIDLGVMYQGRPTTYPCYASLCKTTHWPETIERKRRGAISDCKAAPSSLACKTGLPEESAMRQCESYCTTRLQCKERRESVADHSSQCTKPYFR